MCVVVLICVHSCWFVLTSAGANVCGNGIVESGNDEECDCGDHNNNRAACDMVDRCCDFNCKIRNEPGSTFQCT